MLKKIIAGALLGAVITSSHWIEDARTAGQGNNERPFIVGVFRSDGVIVPFARYANQKWTNPWQTSPHAQTDEPNTIAYLPKPWYESFIKPTGAWQLSLPKGDVLTVQTSKNIQVCSHCSTVWGLLSNYPDAVPAVKNECVRTLGIALSSKRTAPAIERLTNSSTHWEQMLTFLRPEFERAENAGLSELNELFYSQIPAAEERAKVPLSMLNLYRHQLPELGETLFYFEVRKEYPKPQSAHDAGCNNISRLQGWALQDPYGNLALLSSQFSPTDCDLKDSGSTVPFTFMQLDGKNFVLIEEDSYEGESYIILEIRKGSIHRVLETYSGSC